MTVGPALQTTWSRRIADRWIGRRARPDPGALARITGLTPAAVVTGGSAGLGLAIAERFARRGQALIIVARGRERLVSASEALRHAGAPVVVPLALDITDHDAADRIGIAAVSAGLYVDELVNNAAIGLSGTFVRQPAGDIDRLVALNVGAATRLLRAFLPDMLARGRGGVLTVASLGGYTPGPYQATYYASKAFLISLSRAVAFEERGRGVRISVLSPGPVETTFHAAMGAERSLYRLMLPSPDAATVARSAVRGYDWGFAAIHPGLLASAGAVVLSVMPRFLLVPVMGALLWPWRADTDDVRRPPSDS